MARREGGGLPAPAVLAPCSLPTPRSQLACSQQAPLQVYVWADHKSTACAPPSAPPPPWEEGRSPHPHFLDWETEAQGGSA